MKPYSEITFAERIESLKAGLLSAFALTLAYGSIAVGNSLVLSQQFEALTTLQISTIPELFVKVGIAFLSGFLFGVTYRYIVREDQNPHLKDGAVLAFGLVRGLAPVEGQQNLTAVFWLLGILGVESICCFAIARIILDWALHRHWIKTFRSN
ncbi:hypothetical protein [Lyngbya aestuarii]|uniref:hypothetical protein n=1 Tax=Lyngbya aestuarii TaxID=118322 RepID=UPI00403DCFF1